MKKLMLVALSLLAFFGLVGCQLTNDEKDYYATGQWGGWGEAIGNETYKMTAIALGDNRVDSVKAELKGATALYLYEVVIATGAGWNKTYTINGIETIVDGNFCVKVVRTAVGDPDTVDFWAQSPESGLITNLTPETMYMPPFVDTNVGGAGDWNSDPIAYAAGTYYLIYAEIGTAKYMGLIAK